MSRFRALFATLLSFMTSLQAISEDAAFRIGVDSYIYGFPLLVMDESKQISTNVSSPQNFRAPINQFAHAREFASTNFMLHSSPNQDTLSSLAWLDLSTEPMVLQIPTITERYFLFEILDGWSNVIKVIGTQATGNNAQTYLICGPNSNQSTPSNMTRI